MRRPSADPTLRRGRPGLFLRFGLRWALRFLGVGLLLWGLLLLRAVTLLSSSSPALSPSVSPRGALHVHSTRSDGRADLPTIASDARAAGLDFIVLGDHNLTPPAPGVIDEVLVVPGVELSTSEGHILAYGGGEVASSQLRRDDPLGAARASGPLVVLSHPVNLRHPWSGPYRGADAMEVISADSAYRSALANPARLLLAALAYPASADVGMLTLFDGFDAARARFHRALAEGEIAQGLCGHDAHGLPAYAPIFRVLRIHLLLEPTAGDEPEVAASEVIQALAQGRFTCALDGLADPEGFTFEVDADRVGARLGVRPEGASELTFLLYRDGVLQARADFEADGALASNRADPADPEAAAPLTVEAPASPGRWHVEVELERPWLLGQRRFLWILTGVRELPAPEPAPVPEVPAKAAVP